MLGSFNFNSWYFFIRQYIHNTQLRITNETSLTRWHFAIVIIEKGKRFYTLSSCRVIIKSWIILQFTVLVELINVSSCSSLTEWSLSLSLSLSLVLNCNCVVGRIRTRNKKFKSRRLLLAESRSAKMIQ